MTNEEIAADIAQYVKYALSLHVDREAVAVLIAKRMEYYLELTAPHAYFEPRVYRQLALL